MSLAKDFLITNGCCFLFILLTSSLRGTFLALLVYLIVIRLCNIDLDKVDRLRAGLLWQTLLR